MSRRRIRKNYQNENPQWKELRFAPHYFRGQYRDMHRPWEPLSLDQVYDFVTFTAMKTDYSLRIAIHNLADRGLTKDRVKFAEVVINMCHAADEALLEIMGNHK